MAAVFYDELKDPYFYIRKKREIVLIKNLFPFIYNVYFKFNNNYISINLYFYIYFEFCGKYLKDIMASVIYDELKDPYFYIKKKREIVFIKNLFPFIYNVYF